MIIKTMCIVYIGRFITKSLSDFYFKLTDDFILVTEHMLMKEEKEELFLRVLPKALDMQYQVK